MAVLLRGRNKYEMYLVMKKNRQLQRYLPDTMMWSYENFLRMLSKYKSVVVKPNNGKQGQSIYFVDKTELNYAVYINKKRKVFENHLDVFKYIEKAAIKREFIIQQEVNLAKIGERRFDFRIIVQRETNELPWEVTGILARKGGKGYKVTNRRHHGIVLSLEDALKSMNVTDETKASKVKLVKKISLVAAETLGCSFPNQTIFGVDIGMNQNGSLYIFELNRWPLLGGFRSLEDKTQINRIMALKRKK
ncbi:hypothetical protein CR203_03550 [Salipaludibacillus neizhouensis]|uniref:ATP-grasp domain-containing protein n=1 Tax=Salipaludibacillus neizhouensis TaxID=885475 RepID=A0A3A9KHT3_9BACI|nr:YheC/YheD family protein [Salipaludibacillus neizhouensis]RKL69123.1 hypothetical protein CR203_03550 [Salipaludibacillus neizhouensis]